MTSPYLTRQRDRWTRPNARLFVRPDWRRFVPQDQDEHPFAFYENKYRPISRAYRRAIPREGGGRVPEEAAERQPATMQLQTRPP
jgi:hypothetical protein